MTDERLEKILDIAQDVPCWKTYLKTDNAHFLSGWSGKSHVMLEKVSDFGLDTTDPLHLECKDAEDIYSISINGPNDGKLDYSGCDEELSKLYYSISE